MNEDLREYLWDNFDIELDLDGAVINPEYDERPFYEAWYRMTDGGQGPVKPPMFIRHIKSFGYQIINGETGGEL